MAGVSWSGPLEYKEPCPFCGEPDAMNVYEYTGRPHYKGPEPEKYYNNRHSDARHCIVYLRQQLDLLRFARPSEATTNADEDVIVSVLFAPMFSVSPKNSDAVTFTNSPTVTEPAVQLNTALPAPRVRLSA